MKGLTASRKEGLLFLAILAVFGFTSIKVPEEIGVCRYTEAYRANDEIADEASLAAMIGYHLPGGVKVTDPARIAELLESHGKTRPAWAVSMPGVTSESAGSDLILVGPGGRTWGTVYTAMSCGKRRPKKSA